MIDPRDTPNLDRRDRASRDETSPDAFADSGMHDADASAPEPDDDEVVYSIQGGRFQVWPSRYQVLVDGEWVDLTPTEMRVLVLLVDHAGRTWRRSQIVRACHGGHSTVSDRSVDFIVHLLRRKLGPMGELIRTVRSIGFRFDSRRQVDRALSTAAFPLVWLASAWKQTISRLRDATEGVATTAGLMTAAGIIGVVCATAVAGGVWWLKDRPRNAPAHLLGYAILPGDQRDDLASGQAADAPPEHQRVGGLSGLTRVGLDEYLAVADAWVETGQHRAPARLHRLRISDLGSADATTSVRVIGTLSLRDADDRPFFADPLGAYETPASNQLDPTGVVRTPAGTLILSEEYGHALLEFDPDGRLLRRLPLPEKFTRVAPGQHAFHPRALWQGITPFRGLTGVTLTADERHLFTVTQSPLVQDGGANGMYLRLVRFNRFDGKVQEFVYPLDAPHNIVTDIMAIDDHTLWLIEHDLGAFEGYRFSQIVEVDLRPACDVSKVDGLPDLYPPRWFTPVRRRTLACLRTTLGDAFEDGDVRAFQGMALGPNLPDGRRQLVLVSDNGHHPSVPTRVVRLAVPGRATQ
jgi:DNA-binding winged helix-turn-helix (wHTH) protein